MKIIRIIARLNVGGPARHVVWLTRELNEAGHESLLLAGTVPEGEEDMSYFAAEHGVAPVYIPEMSRELSPKDVVSLWKVLRLVWRERPDVIHTHTAKAGTIGRVAGLLYRLFSRRPVKLIHTYHGHVFHSYYGRGKTKMFLLIEKTLARLATDRIIAISAQQKSEINERFGVGRAEKFAVVPLGIDLAPFAASGAKKEVLRAEIGAAPNELLVGFVGRLTEIKNIPLFLRAAKLCAESQSGAEEKPPLKFLVIGDGHLRAGLEREARALGLEKSVLFLGNRTDADVFYAGLDVVALTSLNEGTPLSLIEAMAAGRAVIATAVGGVVDLLGEAVEEKDGYAVCERGLRVAANDAQGFADGLRRLAADDRLRRELGERGRRFIETSYSKERLVRDIERLYRELAGG